MTSMSAVSAPSDGRPPTPAPIWARSRQPRSARRRFGRWRRAGCRRGCRIRRPGCAASGDGADDGDHQQAGPESKPRDGTGGVGHDEESSVTDGHRTRRGRRSRRVCQSSAARRSNGPAGWPAPRRSARSMSASAATPSARARRASSSMASRMSASISAAAISTNRAPAGIPERPNRGDLPCSGRTRTRSCGPGVPGPPGSPGCPTAADDPVARASPTRREPRPG